MGLACVALSTQSQAKVGDTVAQLDQRYGGGPTMTVDQGKAYIHNGLIIVAAFDPAGICQVLMFARLNQPLGDSEVAQLDSENIPAGSGEWRELSTDSRFHSDDTQGQVWLASNLPFAVGKIHVNDKASGLIINGRVYLNFGPDNAANNAELLRKVSRLIGKAAGW